MRLSICTSILLLLLGTLPLEATRIRRLSLEDIRQQATSVLLVEVLNSASRVGRGSMVWTDYRVRIAEVLAGSAAEDTRTLSFAGGTAGSISRGIDGVPRLEGGVRYVIFVDDSENRAVPAVGWGQGIFRIEAGGAFPVMSVDGESLEVDSEGAITRGHLPPGSLNRRLTEPLTLNAAGERISGGLTNPPVKAREGRRPATVDDLRRFVRSSLSGRDAGSGQR